MQIQLQNIHFFSDKGYYDCDMIKEAMQKEKYLLIVSEMDHSNIFT